MSKVGRAWWAGLAMCCAVGSASAASLDAKIDALPQVTTWRAFRPHTELGAQAYGSRLWDGNDRLTTTRPSDRPER